MSRSKNSLEKSALIVCLALIALGIFLRDAIGVTLIAVGVYLLPTVLTDLRSAQRNEPEEMDFD